MVLFKYEIEFKTTHRLTVEDGEKLIDADVPCRELGVRHYYVWGVIDAVDISGVAPVSGFRSDMDKILGLAPRSVHITKVTVGELV